MRLVGQKVAIVSAKAQTTRARLMGIAIQDRTQILLVDTPGIFEPRRRLDRAMVAAAWGGAGDADLILLVIDSADGLNREVERIVRVRAASASIRLWIALNKVDLVKKPNLLDALGRAHRAAEPGQGLHDQRRAGRRRHGPQGRAR